MTAAEHRREAERIIASVKNPDRAHREGFSYWDRLELTALAQVHATLAAVQEEDE